MFTATAFSSEDVVRDGLVLWLDANDKTSYPGTGTIWRDLSLEGNNGTLINGPTFNSGNGGFIRCDGVNDYIEVLDSTSLDFGSGNFTVEYWFRKRVNTSNFSNIWGINKWNTGASPGTNEWNLAIGNGSNNTGGNTYSFAIQVGTTSYGTGLSSEVLSLNVWYQLIAIRNGGTLQTYLNGVLKQNVSPSGFSSSSVINNVGRNLRINNSQLNNLYTAVDNAVIRVYNKEFTKTDVLQNFNSTKSRFRL